MKKLIPVAASFLLSFGCAEKPAQDKPFSEVPSIPKDIDNRALYQQMYANLQEEMPTRSQVNVPAYPNAVVFSITDKDDEKGVLPGVTIMTTDAPEKVRKFYQDKLDDWNFDEKYNVFYQDEAKKFPFEKLNSIPNITIHKTEDSHPGKKIMPEARCYINIVYTPKE
ncbi:hypothetical protein RCC89_13945 [Cytophagaceae bacterium ABcell3]|nr:hypothetical protein RCC89_13945 [Cytophagaceae bacterium ABcell3]